MTTFIWTDNAGRFAARELQRYLRLATGQDWLLADAPELASIHLVLEPTDGAIPAADRFHIVTTDGRATITGANPRSLLYGVYAFLERQLGMRFFAPGREVVPVGQSLDLETVGVYGETARFRWRQIRLEWAMGALLVDWAAKQRFNSVGMDFWQWDTPAGQAVRQAAVERGLELAGTGHGLFHFLPADRYFTAHPEWFPEVATQRVPTRHTGDNFCYSNFQAREALVANLRAFFTAHPELTRLNLWAGDGGFVCQCTACQQRPLMDLYGDVMDTIRRDLAATHPGVCVSQLAYNSGDLRWEELQVPARAPEIPTMFAFWGQNLAMPLATNPDPTHQAFLARLAEFARRAPGQAAIFSYHTDTYVNSDLCPVFASAMAADFQLFEKIGIDEVCLLWLPWHERTPQLTEWVAYQNGALWGRLAMDGHLSAMGHRRDYCRTAYGPDLAVRAETWWNALNRCLGALSALIFPFAPPRTCDAWGCGFNRDVQKWEPTAARGPLETQRRRAFAAAAAKLARLQAATAGPTATEYPEWARFQDYIAHCARRASGLSCLFEAQTAIKRGNRAAARQWLEQALATGMADEREQTEAWLRKLNDRSLSRPGVALRSRL